MLIRYYIDKDYHTIDANLPVSRHQSDFIHEDYLIVVEKDEFKGVLTKQIAQCNPRQPVEKVLLENPTLVLDSGCKLTDAKDTMELENVTVAAVTQGDDFLGVINLDRITNELLHYQNFQAEIEAKLSDKLQLLTTQSNNFRKDLILCKLQLEQLKQEKAQTLIALNLGEVKLKSASRLLALGIESLKEGKLSLGTLEELQKTLEESMKEISQD